MPTIKIKGVPQKTYAVLQGRPAAAHLSLQEYLREHLIEEADQPTLEELLEIAGSRSDGSFSWMRSLRSSAQTVRVTDADVICPS
jgi:antitoxin FitA